MTRMMKINKWKKNNPNQSRKSKNRRTRKTKMKTSLKYRKRRMINTNPLTRNATKWALNSCSKPGGEGKRFNPKNRMPQMDNKTFETKPFQSRMQWSQK
jgi:hypothetical protein